MQTILCPHCKKEIEINKALHDQVLDQAIEEEREKFEKEIEKAKLEEKEKAEKRIKNELQLTLKDMENQTTEEKEKNERLQQQLLDNTKLLREEKDKYKKMELENEKKLLEEQSILEKKLTEQIEEKAKLQIMELTKKLEDTQKSLEDARKKAFQGSQQLQGEVLELQLEQTLTTNFPDDLIAPIPKGVKGADISQTVKTSRGNVCGIILWEVKRTKLWSNDWIIKLKEDLLSAHAHAAIIVSEALPQEATSGFWFTDNVLVCSSSLAISIAQLVRQRIIAVAKERFISEHKQNKTEAEELFSYITSHEFLLQLGTLVELKKDLHEQIQKEKAAFERIWKLREQQVDKIFKTTANIAGSLQAIVGNSFPTIKGLDLSELESGNEK